MVITMNIAFFGDDRYSSIILQHLISYCQQSTIYNLTTIITTQPKPKGRNKIIEPSPVEKLARRQKIKVLYYSAKEPELNTLIQYIQNKNIELGILTSFGHILSEKFLNTFSNGIINIHPSLLPQYRGATPVPYTLALGDQITGVTLFKISSEIDDGKILAQTKDKVRDNDNTTTLLTRLFQLGSDTLHQLLDSNLKPIIYTPHKFNHLRYTPKFTRNEGFIEWEIIQDILSKDLKILQDTQNQLLKLRLQDNPPKSILEALHDLSRALTPWPGLWTIASTRSGNKRLKIIQIKPDIQVHLEGKPNPVSWQEFKKHYL